MLSYDDIKAKIRDGRKHCLVLLRPGPNRDQNETTAALLQEAHLLHLFGLMEQGKLVVNGPVFGDDELLGISIYQSGDREEVRALLEQDPAIAAGRLVYEIRDWFSIDGWGFPGAVR